MESHTLTIERTAYGGYGIGFVDKAAVFVPYSDVGDVLTVRIARRKKDCSFALIQSVIHPSPRRISPECPNFSLCGGCHYLHLPYPVELEIKKEIVADCLRRIGGFDEASLPAIRTVSGERFSYRSHASVKYRGGQSGFYKGLTNELVPFPEGGCALLHEGIRHIPSSLFRTRAGEITIAIDSRGLIHHSGRPDFLLEQEGGILYQRHISCFFQANRFLRGKMLEIVADYSETDSSTRFIDLYCGTGFFSLYIAKRAGSGTGLDRDELGVASAEMSSRLNNIFNIRFKKKDASRIAAADLKGSPGLIIADPPRAGLPKKVRSLIASAAQRLVYVSCNPATFARDARDLASASYRLDACTFIDMFPCTGHIEIISLFRRR